MFCGRYQLETALGRGASGTVYRARDGDSGGSVAIKGLIPDTRPAGANPLLCGSKALPPACALSHPNIAAVYGVLQASSGSYLVMECVEGHDLSRYARPCALLPLATVVSVAARVAEALEHAHLRGVVHGDVKPANIVFDPERDRVKLVDFEWGDADVRGTPAYLSPEQLCGLPATPASDQFSLAATFYHLACGQLPFRASSRPRLAHAIVNEPHRDLRSYEGQLPLSLTATIDRALAKQPFARYPAIGDLGRAFRTAAAALLAGRAERPE